MILRDALRQLQQQGLDRLDAQMLLLLSLERNPNDRAWLTAHDDDALTPDAQARLQALSERRRRGEPMAYLTGTKEFFGLSLQVDARVLVPRPDTETLVQWALDVIDAAAPTAPGAWRTLDLGTGSGAIALAIQSARPHTTTWATDASTDALAVASHNAQALGLPLVMRHGHWLQAVAGEVFDLIVSNPPYIKTADPHLAALTHEPLSALASGSDGLQDLVHLAEAAPGALRPGGWLLLEHGHNQAPAVQALLRQAGFTRVTSHTDLAGIERCTGGQWPQQR